MSLRHVDKIEFDTDGGPKTIELLYGDITCLPVTEKADLLMLSAFHGDYTPTPSSLIGALNRRFALKVGLLARDKEEDLRQLFHCWWSKPLPENLPYRRILCFESSRSSGSPQRSVQAIFRALVPATDLFTDGVIVSPLLSTGDQGYSEVEMLDSIVNSAVTWMENGLNIKVFKLVIYNGNEEILQTFRTLKKKHNRLSGSQMRFKRVHKPVATYDFYLSYASGDKENVEKVKQVFSQQPKQLKFFTSEELTAKSSKDSADEELVFGVMKTCSRVITFLSQSYLEDDDRVEEYNAAWCLNRQNNSITRLAPMLCEAISNLPTYMSLIQWVDIRQQNGNMEKMVLNITLYMVGYTQEIDEDSSSSTVRESRSVEVKKDVKALTDVTSDNQKYDVFISYAHANEDVCKQVVNMLEKLVPGVKLFVDRQQLRTGGSWQQKLYHAVESSHLTIALLSESYLKSRMCNEEFRLSLARHFTDKDYHLIPVQVEPVDNMDDRYLSVRNSTIGGQAIRTYVEYELAPAVKAYLSTKACDGTFIPINKTVYDLRKLLADGRCARLSDLIEKEPSVDIRNTTGKHVLIMCSKDVMDSEAARRIKSRLTLQFKLTVELNIEYKETATVLKKLDEADLILVLVSSHFLKDADRIEELQVAINRQRLDKKRRMYPVLLNSSPMDKDNEYHIYCELLLFDLCPTDKIWIDFTLDMLMEKHVNYRDMMKECAQIQTDFDSKHHDWILEGSHEAEVRLGILEKNTALKQLKFETTVCNRIAYHICEQEYLESQDVLQDVFAIIKEIVLDSESVEKRKEAALEKIGNAYQHSQQSPVPEDDQQSQELTRGKENIAQIKENYDDKSSQACVLL